MRCEDNLISRPIEVLGGMDAETFLRDYWQKAPLLIRQAIPDVGNMGQVLVHTLHQNGPVTFRQPGQPAAGQRAMFDFPLPLTVFHQP